MRDRPAPPSDPALSPPGRVPGRVPGWTAAAPAGDLEEAAFLSGAALAGLDLAASRPGLPAAVWRGRLALAAAEACARAAGRPERAADLRDALHLTRPGDRPGPGGALFAHWAQAVARPLSVAGLAAALPDLPAARIADCLGAAAGRTPVARAAAVLETVLAETPRAGTAALILAEAALARAAGWDHLRPLLAAGLSPRDLHGRGAALRLACHRAVVTGARQAVPLAADLAARADRLRGVAPKLRARAAARAVELILSREALVPAALTEVMSDRAARRLCDRLVALGALRELTGRASFRLYGL